jgi:transposase
MSKRNPAEVREKAVRLALDHLDEYGSACAAAHAIGPMVDVHPETLRVWIVKAFKQRPEQANRPHCARRTGSSSRPTRS